MDKNDCFGKTNKQAIANSQKILRSRRNLIAAIRQIFKWPLKVNFNSNLQHQKKIRDKLGRMLDDASRFSYVAHSSLTAFNVIPEPDPIIPQRCYCMAAVSIDILDCARRRANCIFFECIFILGNLYEIGF